MSILKDPLVLKYFSCAYTGCSHANCVEMTALRILEAQEHPVKKGDRILCIKYFDVGTQFSSGPEEERIVESIAWCNSDNFHPCWLRLPSAFQPSRQTKPDCTHSNVLRNPQSGNWYCEICLVTFIPQPPPSVPKRCDNPWSHRHGIGEGCYSVPCNEPMLTPETPKCLCKEIPCWDIKCGCKFNHLDNDRKPDEVEAKIQRIVREISGATLLSDLEKELHKLVALVKRTQDGKETL